MMSQVVPSDAGLGGALALLQAATDPRAAKAVLDKIAAAKAEVDAKLADLAERQEKFNQGKFEFVREREAHVAAVRDHAKDAGELERAKAAHATAVTAFAQAEKRLKDDTAAREEKFREREVALSRRERGVSEQKKETDTLAAALTKRAEELDRREGEIQAAEAGLQAKRERLAAVLEGR